MNNVQRVLLAIYLTFTAFFVMADNLFPGEDWVDYVKLVTVVTIFFAAFVVKKQFSEQRLLTVATLFTVAGHSCLFASSIVEAEKTLIQLGMLGYAVAYIFLIAAFQKNFKLNKASLIAAIPVLGVYIPVFIKLSSFISGIMFYAAFVFGLILCYMAWTALCTLSRGYYSVKVSRLIALAGYLIFISDMGVANSIFNPAFQTGFVPWLSNLNWVTFVPAWTIIVMVIANKDLKIDY